MSEETPQGDDAKQRPALLPWFVEIFATINLAFLALDIYLAHSVNQFANPLEWIPFVFSCAVPLALLPGCITRRFDEGFARWAGLIVGGASVAVGVLGMILHLESTFFHAQTLKSLVYTAPFVAPLSYAGVGLLLLLNRLERTNWSQWVVFLALAGFIGNFALSVLDHAQNGFFYATEWIPVGAAAFGVAFLGTALFAADQKRFLRISLAVMAVEVLVGVLGFVLHVLASLETPGEWLLEKVIYGAPVFAPLLFSNIAILAGLGLMGMLFEAGDETIAERLDTEDAPSSG